MECLPSWNNRELLIGYRNLFNSLPDVVLFSVTLRRDAKTVLGLGKILIFFGTKTL